MRDHPVIENMEKTGTPYGEFFDDPVCPVCGEECYTFFMVENEIVGCDNCIKEVDAYEEHERRKSND